ncbi:MAG TPA: methyltransferase domain-containing protein [Solirubrobacteraceae bacterium]|nr:methyltransferase domain-containing protein [Solirubrobacteraceae bacterium]
MTSASPPLLASLAESLRGIRPDGVEPPPALLDARVERVPMPGDAPPLLLVRPEDWSALRAAEQEAGRSVPYWAVPWPSGLALARTLTETPPPRGTRVLELGCGLGLPSVAAARGGARVLATDGSPDAAVYAAHTLALNEVEADVLPADWRAAADELEAEPFDLVLAADVLYLRENVESLVRLLPRFVKPGGEIVLADPGRAGTAEFLPIARRIWHHTAEPAASDPERVRLHRLRPR